MDGGAGNDRIEGGDGDDVLRGGINDDVILGGNGIDQLFGDTGTDRLFGDASRNIVSLDISDPDFQAQFNSGQSSSVVMVSTIYTVTRKRLPIRNSDCWATSSMVEQVVIGSMEVVVQICSSAIAK